ncbi:MAG: AAA family ATPase [Spirochaetaceae bacterium]|nr:MAG: AAA family ATPase [Spirochaetaceae bacterium]
MELFEKAPHGSNDPRSAYEPLASRMRPRTIEEYAGQEHILGPGRLLRRAIQRDQLSSLIFWGPPGTGKTTLARVIANTTKSHFSTLNAVLSGVAEIRTMVAEAQERRAFHDEKTILFVDEVHRWNKSQQDALLPWVENGTVILIGATTQNPYFEVNSALVSRSRIFQLLPLTQRDMDKIAASAISDPIRGYGNFKVTIDKEALAHLVKIADGDARSLLNAIELAVETTPDRFPPAPGEKIHVTLAAAEESIQKKALLYDRDGDAHFDTISAYIKSLRGSDPDAAFYWLARMVAAGEDPRFIFRRMLIFACEDVGMADPQALVYVQAAASVFDRIGLPEGRYHLASATLYLATAPKSNSVMGFFDALAQVEMEKQEEVPRHLKDASRDKEGFGHGEGYMYPHAYADHWVAQQYLPQGLAGKLFYQPGKIGYEKQIAESVARRREEQLEATAGTMSPEILSFSPSDKGRELWLMRAAGTLSLQAKEIRDRIFALLKPARHSRVLDCNSGRGLLLWEALRSCPEGAVTGLVLQESDALIISHYAGQMDELSRPFILRASIDSISPDSLANANAPGVYDFAVGRNVFCTVQDRIKAVCNLCRLLSDKAGFAFAEMLKKESDMLSSAVLLLWKEGGQILLEAEEDILQPENSLNTGTEPQSAQSLSALFDANGLSVETSDVKSFENRVTVTEKLIDRWLDANAQQRSYGNVLLKKLGPDGFTEFRKSLIHLLCGRSGHLANSTSSATEIILKTAVVFLGGKKRG